MLETTPASAWAFEALEPLTFEALNDLVILYLNAIFIPENPFELEELESAGI